MNPTHDGGTVIGQGTHGTLTVHPYDSNLIVKTYTDDVSKHKYKMNSCFSGDPAESCAFAKAEYNVQHHIYTGFQNAALSIQVPPVDEFHRDATTHVCRYSMARIFPAWNDSMIIINMYEPDANRAFGHSAFGVELGRNQIPWDEYGYADQSEFAYELGKMFSYLHYVLNMDGYDCELLLGKSMSKSIAGKSSKNSKSRSAFLIDFDKVSCLQYVLGETIYRKLDESTYDPKELKTAKRYGMFLFSAMISMSLVPSSLHENESRRFIQGYRTFVPDDPTNIKHEIAQHVIQFMQEYE